MGGRPWGEGGPCGTRAPSPVQMDLPNSELKFDKHANSSGAPHEPAHDLGHAPVGGRRLLQRQSRVGDVVVGVVVVVVPVVAA